MKIFDCSDGMNLWSFLWKLSKGSTALMSRKDVEVLSMSDKFRSMKSSLSSTLHSESELFMGCDCLLIMYTMQMT